MNQEAKVASSEIPPFADLTPVTTVFDVKTEQRINATALFCLAPRSVGPYLDRPKRGVVPQGLPPTGSITSIKFGNAVRGSPAKTGCMRNMVIVRIVADGRLATINAGGSTLHICGTRSEEQTIRIAQVLLATLIDARDRIQHLLDHYDAWLNWLVDRLDELSREEFDSPDFAKVPAPEDLAWLTPNMRARWVQTAPDSLVGEYLADLTWDYTPRALWELFTRLPDLGNLMMGGDPEITGSHSQMIRYNYRLGFQIDKAALHRVIHEINALFQVDHTATLMRSVKLSLADNIVGEDGEVVTKYHTFNIDWRGTVHQFSPSIEAAEWAYGVLWRTILMLKRSIMLGQ